MGPFLDVDPDPAVWLFGPTPARPVEEWIPEATAAKSAYFGLAEDDVRLRGHVQDVLASTARRHPSPLPWFVLRWTAIDEVPLVVFFGLAELADGEDLVAAWLGAEDAPTVESPIVEPVEAPEGMTLQRSLAFSVDGEGQVVAGLRYVVETGRTDCVVLAHAASDVPREVMQAMPDVEALLRTVRITDEPLEVRA